jgi:hypothetical protein
MNARARTDKNGVLLRSACTSPLVRADKGNCRTRIGAACVDGRRASELIRTGNTIVAGSVGLLRAFTRSLGSAFHAGARGGKKQRRERRGSCRAGLSGGNDEQRC